ncbi:hypothetical protein M899_0664 [Bacteriovorax sp. BSW11_IV]|uniref:hypothetical protein n=1 Tax=Bacteriovorax sp. BSW11_IV TaxID=1353529 RepID=UPI00038A33AA|nr:hypothetical protein [Bacteriovorax sp. BSW11_IV]EQC49023.1 hypothetical protein M899_0664 [Bacteriovorax sp. BSW11_IV]
MNTKAIEAILNNMPADWLKLTTHRLDIYNESKAKFEFLEHFENVLGSNSASLKEAFSNLPTAYDYIRLGHPLSCVLEWVIADEKKIKVEDVISFSSTTMPILAVLRSNHLKKIKTQIVFTSEMPKNFDQKVIHTVYGYEFELIQNAKISDLESFNGTRIVVTSLSQMMTEVLPSNADFIVGFDSHLGSIILVNGDKNKSYVSDIQHVRRRESIAMTPHDCMNVLETFAGKPLSSVETKQAEINREFALKTIRDITHTKGNASLGSSGLSVQYAIMMGLIDYALQNHKGKSIKFVVPPNCYGGTNDQARRVAASTANVEILDLHVDGGKDMVTSLEGILDRVANDDAIAFIIAEIPTNPRVEVPDLEKLKLALGRERKTKDGKIATLPVFILDQTFCPNVKFLGAGDFLSSVKTISYVSGSKFPSGGLCTAGYCVANDMALELMTFVDTHLKLCANEANDFQIEVLAKQLPTMNERIHLAYKNTRAFVNHIHAMMPDAKINFVSEELADAGFTPSVFSLDLPTRGNTPEEREAFKRKMNLKLINLMIQEIPNESKHCVSYGQLKGCYWTIPATSTQGTTKEGDKDYIVRVAVSPDFDLDHHKNVFSKFCSEY